MVRSPLPWVLSLYLHFYPQPINDQHFDANLTGFIQGLFASCKALARGSNRTNCRGHLYGWYSGGAPAAPGRCASFVSFFTRASHLLLVAERCQESIWLLYQLLGWGSPPKLEHRNARPDATYGQKLTLRSVSSIASTQPSLA
jgi:hypothetical protein